MHELEQIYPHTRYFMKILRKEDDSSLRKVLSLKDLLISLKMTEFIKDYIQSET